MQTTSKIGRIANVVTAWKTRETAPEPIIL